MSSSRLALPALAALVLGCPDRPPEPSHKPAPRAERLHRPGELRLTSAGTKPRLRLRYRLEAGDRQAFRTRIDIRHEAAGQTSNLVARLDWERQVESLKGSAAQVRVTVQRVRFVRPASIRDDVTRRLGSLTLRHTLDTRGRVLAVQPGASLPAGLSESTLRNVTAPLPEDPVGDGATWERFEPVDVVLPKTGYRLRLGVRTRYTLTILSHRGRERFALIRAKLRLTAQSLGQELTGLRVTGGGRGTSELKLDLKRLALASSSSEATLELSLERGGTKRQLKQATRISTQPLKTKPPRPPKPK